LFEKNTPILAVLLLIMFSSSLYAQTQIAVVNFKAQGISTQEVAVLTDRLMVELFRTNKFIVLEREMLDKIIEEQKFQLSGCNSDECLVELGQIANVEQMVGGTVSKLGDVYSVTARLISVETGRVVNTGIYDHEGKLGALIKTGMANIASQLASLPLTAIHGSEIVDKPQSQNITTTDFLTQKKRLVTERRLMLQYVYEKAVLDAVISDRYLHELYAKSSTEINARHILIQFDGIPRSGSDRSKTEALALMGQISNRLSQGEPFENLAMEFTEDPSGKENGGDLGWFGWGKMVESFQEAAFKMDPGEISSVVETSFGFHIIKLEATRELVRGTFEDAKSSLKQQASKAKSQELGQKANQFLEDLKLGSGFEIITDNVHDLFMVFDKSSNEQRPMDEVLKKLNFSAPLFMLNGEDLGSSWIIEELKALDDGQKPRVSSENQLLSILDQLVTQTLIRDYGYSQRYEQDPEFIAKIKTMEKNSKTKSAKD
jgi:TolB-like protein